MKARPTSVVEIREMAQEMADKGASRQSIFDQINRQFPGRESDLAEIVSRVFLARPKEKFGKYFNAIQVLPLMKAALMIAAMLVLEASDVYVLIPFYFAPFIGFCLILAWFAQRRERIFYSKPELWVFSMLLFDLIFTLGLEQYWFGICSVILHISMYHSAKEVYLNLFQDYHIHSRQKHREDGTIISVFDVRFPD